MPHAALVNMAVAKNKDENTYSDEPLMAISAVVATLGVTGNIPSNLHPFWFWPRR